MFLRSFFNVLFFNNKFICAERRREDHYLTCGLWHKSLVWSIQVLFVCHNQAQIFQLVPLGSRFLQSAVKKISSWHLEELAVCLWCRSIYHIIDHYLLQHKSHSLNGKSFDLSPSSGFATKLYQFFCIVLCKRK